MGHDFNFAQPVRFFGHVLMYNDNRLRGGWET